MYTEEERNLIVLSSIAEISYKCREILLEGLTRHEPDFAKYERTLIKTLSAGVYNKVKAEYFGEEYRRKLFEELEKKQIECVTVFSERYPVSLRNTPAPPHVLFCKGNVSLLGGNKFGIVGSRRTAKNTAALTEKVYAELTRYFTVVSGIADGGDTAAVKGALKSGKIISVLAYGFDYFYPACNEKLIKEVACKGLLVTEHPPGVRPAGYLFPVRNRIIAGLVRGVLIVSAGKRSGAGITANYAAEYGRDVFAFPYSVGVDSGEGCNAIIKNGGMLAENAKDILSAYNISYEAPAKQSLTAEEVEILEAIRAEGEAFISAIAEKLGKQPYQLIAKLSALEIKGLIVRLGGNRYSCV